MKSGVFLSDRFGAGHWQDEKARTGCTVIAPRAGICVAGIAWRGAAPATRELDLLHIDGVAPGINAICLSGGSAFGLESSTGVTRYLEQNGIGFDAGVATVPLVPALSIFDLAVGNSEIRPDADSGYSACEAIAYGSAVRGGVVGAGTGATVNKISGMESAKQSGIGLCSAARGELVISTLSVCNAFGTIIDRNAAQLFPDADAAAGMMTSFSGDSGGNCTFAVCCIEADFNRKEADRMAEMAFAGLSRAIRPAHTSFDFDAVIVLTSGEQTADPHLAGMLAAETVHQAIVDGCS